MFVGDITELNKWNFTLEERDIQLKGKCKNFDKGNIISYSISRDLDNFNVNEVKIEDWESMEDLCKPVEHLLLFQREHPGLQLGLSAKPMEEAYTLPTQRKRITSFSAPWLLIQSSVLTPYLLMWPG